VTTLFPQKPLPSVQPMAWGQTDIGRRRQNNEDNFLVDVSQKLFAVADGMGGHAAGETASRLAVEFVQQDVLSSAQDSKASLGLRLARSVQRACAHIFEQSQKNAELDGMGTTFTGAIVENNVLSIAHVGDSRAYLFRYGELFQISEDHSLVQELINMGRLTPEEAKVDPRRHVITRSLGNDPFVDVDSIQIPLLHGDLLMLCSDGLVNMVDSPADLSQVMAHTPFPKIPERLIELANERGGEDNISVVLVYFA
jgi:serine/threonine protein phosphatase PrpC